MIQWMILIVLVLLIFVCINQQRSIQNLEKKDKELEKFVVTSMNKCMNLITPIKE